MDRAILGALRVVGMIELARKAEQQTAIHLEANGAPARASMRRLWIDQLRALERIGEEIARSAGWDGSTPLDVLEERAAWDTVDDERTPITQDDLGPLIRSTRAR